MADDNDSARSPHSNDDGRPDLLLFGIQSLRLLIPSLGLFLLLCQVLRVLLRALFARLQASSFLESRSGYQAIPSAGEAIDTSATTSTSLVGVQTKKKKPKTINGITFVDGRVSAPPDENGILPVVVPVLSLRRGLVYTFFSLGAVTYLIDGGILIAHSIVNMKWESKIRPGIYTYEEYYTLGSATTLCAQLLYMAWQERSRGLGNFKRTYPILVVLSLWASEIALLGLFTRYISIHSNSPQIPENPKKLDAWTIAHISIQSARVLDLTLLLLSFTRFLHRRDFKKNEYTALLAEAEQEAENLRQSGTATPSNGYGTFGITPRNGKPIGGIGGGKLGGSPPQKKEMSFAQRIKILGPYLWPKKSRTLQVVACEYPCAIIKIIRKGRFIDVPD